MQPTKYQQLLAELEHWRRRTTKVLLGETAQAVPVGSQGEAHPPRADGTADAERVSPFKTISGAVAGGPTLLVENRSPAHLSVGVEVHVGAADPSDETEGRTFGLSATTDQQEGVGVIGRGDYGVVGQSPGNVGVMGFGTTGVYGFSNDPEGRGVEGHTASASGIGVLASAPEPEMIALAIDTGQIRVLGAGEHTATPVFVHVASEQNTRGSQTVIDHPMSNGDPHALLIVTRRETLQLPENEHTALPHKVEPWSVAYSTRASKWLIVQPEGTLLPLGTAFNVLIVKA